MLFNSYTFILLFLPIVLIGFFVLGRSAWLAAALAWLLISSLVFYSNWNIAYLPILLGSIFFNFAAANIMSRCGEPGVLAKIVLAGAITGNLLALGYFKYSAFVVSIVNRLLHTSFIAPDVSLPLGISFFTFTQIAYLVDTYRDRTSYTPLLYGQFVTFFPHLIAGPILYHKSIMPQLAKTDIAKLSYDNMALGVSVFILGLAKKVLLADSLAPWVAPVFDHAAQSGFIEAWTGALAYTLQLYFDFSGYSEMALGLGLMLNVQLPVNFLSPYKATSIIDFWKRWHITLSFFLKNYLYIPLGGNRSGKLRRHLNLLTTMLLGGLWHGAGWTFIAWGGFHGGGLIVNHLWRDLKMPMNRFIAHLVTFVFVVFGWVLFRAHKLGDALQLWQAMLGVKGFAVPENLADLFARFGYHGLVRAGETYLIGGKTSIIMLIVVLAFTFWLPNITDIMSRFKTSRAWLIGTACLATFSFLSLNHVAEFLYFQF